MKKFKNFFEKYKMMLLVEFLVIAVMLGSAGMMYKQTYELEYERVMSEADNVGRVTEFDEESDRGIGEFLVNVQENIINGFNWDYGKSKYCGYGVAWEIYDENNNVLMQSTENDLMLIWENTEPVGEGTSYINNQKAYLVENYFTEDEMEGAWEFIFSIGAEDPMAEIIEKVVGYYDENNEFVPVEIVFWDFDSKENYSLKSKENVNKQGIEYITIKGDSIAAEYVTADVEGFFSINNLRKRKDSVNKALEKAKEKVDEGEYDYSHESGYLYTRDDLAWSNSTNENMMSDEEKSEADWVRFWICADLNYMVLNNAVFKIFLIIDITLCLLIGVGIIYIVRKNDEKRKYLDSMKYTFINAMAHEMKTPSAVIVNSAECIKDGVKPEKQSKYLDKMKKEGLHMNRLLLDMLTYTKLTDEERKIYKEEISMKELLEEVIEHYTDAIEKKDIKVEWDISSENTIMADRKLMEMVVDNYLSNAVKYCKETGIIRITIDEKKIVVYDSGENIYPTKLKAIWEPLYVIDESRKNREGSSGMGLAISARIMELHGMEYGARNTADGVEFYIKMD